MFVHAKMSSFFFLRNNLNLQLECFMPIPYKQESPKIVYLRNKKARTSCNPRGFCYSKEMVEKDSMNYVKIVNSHYSLSYRGLTTSDTLYC